MRARASVPESDDDEISIVSGTQAGDGLCDHFLYLQHV